MKTNTIALVACAALGVATTSPLAAQTSLSSPESDWPGWAIAARDGSTTTREYTNLVAGALGEAPHPEVHRITEVGASLNYQDDNGEWQPAADLIELMPDGGAAALRAQNKMHFSADLTSDGAITLVTKSNRVFKTHPIGLYYSSLGKAVLIAPVRDSAVAELLPPNQILYRGAFDSDAAKADLRITFTKGGYESDVIFTRKPKAPETFSLDPSTAQIQVRHAWLNAPIPHSTTEIIGPNLTDEFLDFGEIFFGPGRALIWDISGSVTFHITRTAGLNAVLSGIFFGPASSF